MELTHLSLFSGIGGLDLAAEWAGFKTVGQCEWADYPTKVLEKHWPDVPRWRDIRTLTGESFYERTGLRTVDIISGGFPCQPFSVAGKRRGQDDDRYLWPEMLRVAVELNARWIVGENVAGIVNMALDQVLFDLESAGYSTQSFIIPACAVDAQHRRDRAAIIANSSCDISNTRRAKPERQQRQAGIANGGNDVADSGSNTNNTAPARYRKHGGEIHSQPKPKGFDLCGSPGRWSTEPDVGRVANGIPNRVDRLKCLGNAVVPQQFYPVFEAIYKIEAGNDNKATA